MPIATEHAFKEKSAKLLILLPLRTILKQTFQCETPCIYRWTRKEGRDPPFPEGIRIFGYICILSRKTLDYRIFSGFIIQPIFISI